MTRPLLDTEGLGLASGCGKVASLLFNELELTGTTMLGQGRGTDLLATGSPDHGSSRCIFTMFTGASCICRVISGQPSASRCLIGGSSFVNGPLEASLVGALQWRTGGPIGKRPQSCPPSLDRPLDPLPPSFQPLGFKIFRLQNLPPNTTLLTHSSKPILLAIVLPTFLDA